MKRAIKASIAALALVPAGIAMAAPAGADGRVSINLNPNHCQALANGGQASCFFVARPDSDSFLYVETLSGTGNTTAELFCNGTLMASVTDPAGGGRTRLGPFVTPGGVCELKVTASSDTKGMAWTAPNPAP